jgi:histidinol-phosphate aminotransferase
MNTWLQSKIRQLEQAEGYLMPESTPAEGAEEARVDIVKLDANENVFLPREFMKTLAGEAALELDPRFYSTQEYWQLVRALGDYVGLGPEHIVLANGGDQVIDFVAKTFLEEGGRAVSIAPTYSFYRLRAKLAGAEWVDVPLRADFSLDADKLLEAADGARVIFLCSPNNPTGNQFEAGQLQQLLRSFDGMVLVDEAYAEFAGETVARWVAEFENLIVLRTFSKAFGLAGLRLGYMIAGETMARAFAEKIQYPYPVSSFTMRMALKLMHHLDFIRSAVAEMKTARARLTQALSSIDGIRPFESEGNFILFQLPISVDRVHDGLMKEGIFVKKVGTVLHLANCLRTTVGTPDMNDRLLAVLRQLCH